MRTSLLSSFVIVLCLILAACQTGNIYDNSREITEEVAIRTAVRWLGVQDPSRTDFQVDKVDLEVQNNRATSYRIQFRAGGFVIVSSSCDRDPIIAYSNDTSLTGNSPQAQDFVRNLVSHVSRLDLTSVDNGKGWSKLSSSSSAVTPSEEVIEPLIQTNWSQSGGYNPNFTYNKYTPYVNESKTKKAPVGCAAVAFGQVLKYYDFPKQGFSYNRYCSTGKSVYNCWDGEIIEADFGVNYHWDAMPASLNSISASEQIDAVAQLLFHIGVSLNVKYAEHGSNAQIENPSVFAGFKKHFRLTEVSQVKRMDYSDQEWTDLIKNELRNHRPVILSGYDSRIGAGHAYIVDGLDGHGYVHVNWGWGGAANGYFDLETLTINHPSAGSLSFTEDLIAFVNFTPNSVAQGESCNGPEGLRCLDGLLCAIGNDITNVVDEFSSDEYGTCMDEDTSVEPPEEFVSVSEEREGAVAKDEWKHFGPFDSKQDVSVVMSGSGDADLYVKEGSQPTSSSYDCRPYKSSSMESCSIQGPGSFFVSVNGYADQSEFKLVITVKE